MFQLLAQSKLYMFGWNWAHNVNDGMDGNNDACDKMSHDKTLGQDDACLGGWSQHQRYGFAQSEQAYTSESTYRRAKSGFTGIFA
mmetsp:Transcript_33649/g.80230  ORF Transcript_33649/g.80230 Transcript_33649/m.80230 type:complete len:85 (-) Transcript_33649:162-416(-)